MKMCVSVGIGLFCATAGANTITLKHNSGSGYGARDTARITFNGNTQNVYAGVYALDRAGGTGLGTNWADGARTVSAFCMDILQHAPGSYATYDVVALNQGPDPFGPMGTMRADALRELWGRYFDAAWMGSGPFTSSQNAAAEAFEICVWEIIFEDLPTSPAQWDVTRGKFSAGSIDYQRANTWLHSLDGTGPKANLVCLSNGSYQDFPTVTTAPPPEPETLAFLASPLPLWVGLRRKRLA